MDKILGIDFGTTNTVVAFTMPDGPKVILDHQANRLTPSIVASYRGDLLVGHDAKDNIAAFVDGTGIKEVKREIGSSSKLHFAGQRLFPYEVAAIILKKAKRNADLYLGEGVKKAVITVPAEFSDSQRREIEEAGKIAGFVVEKVINEPTAALMAYAYDNPIHRKKTFLCYDFGGGTFDVSIADVTSEGIDVKAVDGDRKLGGADIDQLLFEKMKQEIEQQHHCRLNDYGRQRLYLEVERLKIQLSSKQSESINQHFETTDGRSVHHFRKMTRTEMESLISRITNKTMTIIEKVLHTNGYTTSSIDEVLLVGGSSQIPLVQNKIKQLFGVRPITNKHYADESVAIGAAIEASHKASGRHKGIGPKIITDVSPYTIGLKVSDGAIDDVFDPIIKKNFPYGREVSETYHTILDYQKSMLLEIYQGEHARATQNEHITNINITGIPEREAGKEYVKVSFIYDESGVIHIKATVLSTGEVFTHDVSYKKKFTHQKTMNSKSQVEAHFSADELFEEGVFIKQQLDKHNYKEKSEQIKKALEKDDKYEIENIKSALFDE